MTCCLVARPGMANHTKGYTPNVRALVTGVTGFTGGHLAHHLLDHGYHVRGLVRGESVGRAAVLTDSGVQVVKGDLTDPASLEAACQGVDVVFHIAATYRTAGHGASTYHSVNVVGTENLLEAALCAGVDRVVHCSTGGVHGHVEHPPANEDAPLSPGDIYQRSKLEAEQYARRFGIDNDIEVVIARPIGIYGPGDTRFLKMFRLARGRIPLLGDGQVFYHLTFIDDLVDGLRRCGESPAAVGRTYLLAGNEYTTLKELMGLIAAELGASPPRWHFPAWPVWVLGALCEFACVPFKIEPPLYRRRVDFFLKSRAFDTTRARTELLFSPETPLRAGIRKTADWYSEQGLL